MKVAKGRCWGRAEDRGSARRTLLCRIWTELSERLRLRRGRGDTSEDDEGLPHSPCNSPITTDALLDRTTNKDLPTKSHSTCSDGSLLSMGSSEMDEESLGQHSRDSSKLSLHEKDLDLSVLRTTTPLNHDGAHHRVSLRPQRRPPNRTKKANQLSSALPTTPEVNEDSSLTSIMPEISTSRETTLTELYSNTRTTLLTETQLKCSSLPPGLVGPVENKLNRSQSNAGSKSHDHFDTLEEEPEDKTDKSFFDRIFPRRSAAKKKKSKEQDKKEITLKDTTITDTITKEPSTKRNETKPIAAPRGPASRQRILPIDLPESPEITKNETIGHSPLQIELENRFKQRQSPELSPKFQPSSEFRNFTRNEEIRSKMKIPGLSSLQQRVLYLNEDVVDDGFKSLTDLPEPQKTTKSVSKSHSFKSTRLEEAENIYVINQLEEKRNSGEKIASLDSVSSDRTSENFFSHDKYETSTDEEINKKFLDQVFEGFGDSITISGPSHTAVVNISSKNTVDSVANVKTEKKQSGDTSKEITTKESISVTKIQTKRETNQVTQGIVTVPKNQVPEFLNRQLNKVELKPVSNVVFSTSPKIVEDQFKPKLVLSSPTIENKDFGQSVRKFSQENLEIVDKSPPLTPTNTSQPMGAPRFKKNESARKKSIPTPESVKKPFVRSRSISLDSLKNETESSQESLDKLEEESVEGNSVRSDSIVETVVLRKKSLIKQKKDEEPELMKVFARRSLKLKDSDSEIVAEQVKEMMQEDKTKDNSDKENHESPKEERKKMKNSDETKTIREPLIETKEIVPKVVEKIIDNNRENNEVTLRKPIVTNNNFYGYQRAFSVNVPKTETSDHKVIKKQASFSNDRRKTDNWIKNGDENVIERKLSQDEEIITGFSSKNDFSDRKNFNQRKAEWEKRAQEAQKKTVP